MGHIANIPLGLGIDAEVLDASWPLEVRRSMLVSNASLVPTPALAHHESGHEFSLKVSSAFLFS
jgi:hypothetical protein